MDISMFMKIDDSDWGRITDTEPVDIVLEIPDQYKGLSDDYYIMRAHLGQSTLLKDIDEDADTITISTGQFSTYALMYNDAPVVATNVDLTSSAKCTFCHMCPTFLGICYFVWLFIFAVIVTMYTTYRTQKRHEKNND